MNNCLECIEHKRAIKRLQNKFKLHKQIKHDAGVDGVIKK